MSKSIEHKTRVNEDSLTGDVQDAVTFSPSFSQVTLPPYTDVRNEPTSPPEGRHPGTRTRWIAIAVSVASVCLLIIILGCVFMIHLHPNLNNDQNNGKFWLRHRYTPWIVSCLLLGINEVKYL